MHCGYPVMAFKCVAAELVSVQGARSGGLWGPIHELGHNQQRGCWEFPSHTTECTCNLWSVYVHEEVLGINRAQVELISCFWGVLTQLPRSALSFHWQSYILIAVTIYLFNH